jgi:two-component system cell cycle sensor histidine kinase/response regulator CckA
VEQVLALVQAEFRVRNKNPPREGNSMSKSAVRIRASKSTGEATFSAVVGPRSADSQTIHPAHPGSGEQADASSGNSLFAALTESLAPLLAETAHDLKNAFGSIRLYFDLLELESASSERVRQRLREIRPMLDHAQDLTRQLMNPVTLGHTGKQPASEEPDNPFVPKISLNPVLQRMVPMLSAILQPDVALRLRLAPDLVAVAIDPSQVVRIISNLVLNSRDALSLKTTSREAISEEDMGPCGEVSIETANWRIAGPRLSNPPGIEGDPRKPKTPGIGEDSQWVLLRVRDTGLGMTDGTRARIFQPFFTTKPPDAGSGLGLSSVLRMVQCAGGHIQVESSPEKGTDITILFPAAGARGGTTPQRSQSGIAVIFAAKPGIQSSSR